MRPAYLNVESEIADAVGELGRGTGWIMADEVIGAEILVAGAVREHVLGAGQDRDWDDGHPFTHQCLSRSPCDPRSEAAPSPGGDETAQPAHRGTGVRAPNPYRKPRRPPRPSPCSLREWRSWPGSRARP